MTEKTILWPAPTSGDGAANYTDEEITRMFRHLVGDTPASECVLTGVGGELAPSGTASPVSIAAGSAFAYGFFYWNTAPVNVVIPTPSIGTTGHRIVLRLTWSTQEGRLTLLSSSDGVAAIPGLTQTPNTIYDVPICSLTITTGGVITITDQRGFLHFGTAVNNAMLDALAVATANLQDLAVTTAKLANLAVTEAKLGNLAVTTGKIQNAAVTSAKMQDGAALAEILDDDGAGSGLDADLLDGQHGAYYAPSTKGVTNGDSHDHNGGDGAQIPTGGIANNAVDDTKLRDSAAMSVIGRSANSLGDPADIAAAVDGYVLRRYGTTLGFGQVQTAGLADQAVAWAKILDGTINAQKIGAEVPTMERRIGGDSLDFNIVGALDWPVAQVGCVLGTMQWTGASASSGSLVVNFKTTPTPTWDHIPTIAGLACNSGSAGQAVTASVGNITKNGFTIYWKDNAGTNHTSLNFSWIAYGDPY